jgi:hypothetical protein
MSGRQKRVASPKKFNKTGNKWKRTVAKKRMSPHRLLVYDDSQKTALPQRGCPSIHGSRTLRHQLQAGQAASEGKEEMPPSGKATVLRGSMNRFEVSERDAGICVVYGDVMIGPVPTNASAWSWIDQHSDEGWSDTDRYCRIRQAFNGSYRPDRYCRPSLCEGVPGH